MTDFLEKYHKICCEALISVAICKKKLSRACKVKDI